MSSDSYTILSERHQAAITLAPQRLTAPLKVPPLPNTPTSFLITGIGSSAAHAQYLTSLINQYTLHSAQYVPLSHFYSLSPGTPSNTHLIIFSQGLSPNSHLALQHASAFEHTTLFTGVTRKNTDNSTHLALLAAVDTVIEVPSPNEYQTFVRTLGPMLGYAIAYQWLSNAATHHTLPAVPNTLSQALSEIEVTSISTHTSPLLITSPALAPYATNLALKVSETLFLPQPTLTDPLAFAHGPLQAAYQNQTPLLIFKEKAFDPLFKQLEECLSAYPGTIHTLTSPLPAPFSIFYWEATLNLSLLEHVKQHSLDNINWPGKNLDAPLYQINSYL